MAITLIVLIGTFAIAFALSWKALKDITLHHVRLIERHLMRLLWLRWIWWQCVVAFEIERTYHGILLPGSVHSSKPLRSHMIIRQVQTCQASVAHQQCCECFAAPG